MKQCRDLTILSLNDNEQLIIACDSSAGIGRKKYDMVQTEASLVAGFCLRVPLMELISVGAEPLMVVDTIGNEWEPTGKDMLEGIQRELALSGFREIPVNGSTEENMSTLTTSIGITVIGKVLKKHFKYGKLAKGDVIYQLGVPRVGDEVIRNLGSIFSYDILNKLVIDDRVREVLPVGSKGVLNEARQLVRSSNLRFDILPERVADDSLTQSAGPATVLLVAVKKSETDSFEKSFKEMNKLGTVL